TTPFPISAPPLAAILLVLFSMLTVAGEKRDLSPRPEEQQVPRAMHSQMKERPRVTVGLRNADIIGADNRALQGAVDYVAGLGGHRLPGCQRLRSRGCPRGKPHHRREQG